MWEVPEACFDAADLTVPAWRDLPLDLDLDENWVGPLREQLGHAPSYRDYAALLYGLQYLADELGAQV